MSFPKAKNFCVEKKVSFLLKTFFCLDIFFNEKKIFQAKLDSFKSEENKFVEQIKTPIRGGVSELRRELETWNNLMRKNTKASGLFAFVCKKPKISGDFHDK